MHEFCSECLNKWFQVSASASATCPICRQPVDGHAEAVVAPLVLRRLRLEFPSFLD